MSQRRYAANHFTSCRWVASCKLRRATCNPRRMPALDPLPGGQPAFCEPQSASRRQSARCTSQIAARRIDARHVRMVSTELLGLAANPRAAIREPQSARLWASRKPELADCSSQHRGQACAEARLQLAEHRSQLADRGAGSPVPPIAACTSQLARRRLLSRGSKADPILLSQNRRPHSRRSQHFGQEVKAEVNCGSHSRSSLVARCRSLSRRDYLHEDRLHACKVHGA